MTILKTNGVIHTPVIAKNISLRGFSDNSVMVKFIKQKQWKKLFQVSNNSVNDVKDFHTVREDGISMDKKPLGIHVRMLKCFLLYYKRKCREHGKHLSENNVMKIERNQFYSYCGSPDYFMDLAACVEESSIKQVATLNTSNVDVVNAPESIKTEDARCSNLSDEVLDNVDVEVVPTRHLDVISDDLFVSERNIGEDVLLTMDSSQHIAQKHLKEATATDESSIPPIRDPNAEYNPYRDDTNISKVLVDGANMVLNLDESKGVSKHPYKLRERNMLKQEHIERLIEYSFAFHESRKHRSKGDPQVDFALMSFDMHHLVSNTYGDDDEGDDDDVDEDVDHIVDKSIATVEEIEDDDGEDVTSRIQEMIPDHVEWGYMSTF